MNLFSVLTIWVILGTTLKNIMNRPTICFLGGIQCVHFPRSCAFSSLKPKLDAWGGRISHRHFYRFEQFNNAFAALQHAVTVRFSFSATLTFSCQLSTSQACEIRNESNNSTAAFLFSPCYLGSLRRRTLTSPH